MTIYIYVQKKCHSVDFWNRALDDRAIIINGECFHDGGNKPNEKRTYLLGHSGRRFKIQFKETGDIIETNNLWYNGVIPKERNIADNAVFIDDFYADENTLQLNS